MSGDLKVAVGVHNLSSPTLTTKHYIDADTNAANIPNPRPLKDESGNEVKHNGQTVYISDKGEQLLTKWRGEDNNPNGGIDMGVQADAMMSDWFWGRTEEDR